MANIVYAALPIKRLDSPTISSIRVGYFASKDDLPDGWQLADKPETDISEIMSINNWSYDKALEMMNK